MAETNLYRPTLKKAWQIAMRFKLLWILGFFATLLSTGGEYEIITRFFYDKNNGGFFAKMAQSFSSGIAEGLQSGGNLWQNIYVALTTTPTATLMGILVIILAAVITIFFIWLGVISQIALIKNVAVINENKKTTINEGIDHGVKNFWPILWSNVILKIGLFVLFLIFGWIASLLAAGWWQTAIYIVVFIVFIIVTLLASSIFKFQMLYVINDKERFGSAFKSGWNLFKANWLICLETAAILLVVYIVGMFISAFASMILTAGPLFVMPIYFPTIAPIAGYIILGICMVLMVIIIILVAAFITTYQWATWTILFGRISKGVETGKITRLAEQITNLPPFGRN